MSSARLNPHATSPLVRVLGVVASCLVNVGIFSMIALSDGSSSSPTAEAAEKENSVFCRYIENGRLSQFEVKASDWQKAEETVCGSKFKEVRLGNSLIEGARLLLKNPQDSLILIAQRESCSCSSEDKVPVLQDIGIVEAPRLGAEVKKTAMPRIFNTPQPTEQNVITTNKVDKPKQEKQPAKPVQKAPSLDDLLNAASNFDDARPVSDVDPGGSADGSRLSKSATGQGDPYLQKIKAKLDNSMNAPASIPKSQLQKLNAKLWIMVGDGGVLWKWEYVKKSGDSTFDKMIETTLKQFMLTGTSRFAPPPENWKNQRIAIAVDGKDIR